MQDREEAVRTAAAEAIAQAGFLDPAAIATLVEGLASKDNVVRAQTAEALGTIGATAAAATPALVEAMRDDNGVVRARVVEALGKMGEAAAEAAVPSLKRALRIRTTGSVPWRRKPWDRWGSRPTVPFPHSSDPSRTSTPWCEPTPRRRWGTWVLPRPAPDGARKSLAG